MQFDPLLRGRAASVIKQLVDDNLFADDDHISCAWCDGGRIAPTARGRQASQPLRHFAAIAQLGTARCDQEKSYSVHWRKAKSRHIQREIPASWHSLRGKRDDPAGARFQSPACRVHRAARAVAEFNIEIGIGRTSDLTEHE